MRGTPTEPNHFQTSSDVSVWAARADHRDPIVRNQRRRFCGCQPVSRSFKMIDDDTEKQQKINKKPDGSGCRDIDHKPRDSPKYDSPCPLSPPHPPSVPSNPCPSHTQYQFNIIVTGSGPSHNKHGFTATHRVHSDGSCHSLSCLHHLYSDGAVKSVFRFVVTCLHMC